MDIIFQEGDRGRQRAGKLRSWPAVGGVTIATFTSKCRDPIRLATAGQILFERQIPLQVYIMEYRIPLIYPGWYALLSDGYNKLRLFRLFTVLSSPSFVMLWLVFISLRLF